MVSKIDRSGGRGLPHDDADGAGALRRPRLPSQGYLPQLDGLRAVAVLFVILFHTQSSWFPGGYIGVDLFFVLSGFLITGILVSEYDRTGRVALGAFYARRALRLLPALLFLALVLCVAYLVLVGPEQRERSIGAVLAAIAYATSPLAAAGVDLGSMLHAWSLSVEEYFYVVWPILLILLLRWVGRKRAIAAVAAVVAVAIGYRLIAALLGWPLERIYYAADTRAEQLLIGCLLALILVNWADRRPPAWLSVVSAVVLAAFVVTPGEVTAPFYRFGGSTFIAGAAALTIWGLVARSDGIMARSLAVSPMVWVGKRSYGIYLWHAPIAALIVLALPEWVPLLPADLVITLVVAALSFRYIETPFLKLKTHFGARRRSTGGRSETGADLAST